jgi:hypothetical protein
MQRPNLPERAPGKRHQPLTALTAAFEHVTRRGGPRGALHARENKTGSPNCKWAARAMGGVGGHSKPAASCQCSRLVAGCWQHHGVALLYRAKTESDIQRHGVMHSCE